MDIGKPPKKNSYYAMPYRSQGCGFLFVVWAPDEKIYKMPRLLRYLMQDQHSTKGHNAKLFA